MSKNFQDWDKILSFSEDPGIFENIKPFAKSLNLILKSKDARNAIGEILEYIGKLNSHQIKNLKNSNSNKKVTLTGNNLYDLMSSPAMKEIVREVLKVRKIRRRRNQ